MIHNSDLEGSSDKYDCLIIDDQSSETPIKKFCRRPIEHFIHRNHRQIDCQNGVDDLSLEIDQMEYQCRQGTCIPLQTTFDKVIDYRANTNRLSGSSDFICDIIELLFCHKHACGRQAFSCGGGTCTYTLWTKPI
ncbi:unnamed protein product [Rotaria socialis]|uniref:Uncharacterized protein n=1 Tax=Rotaria socialis TaxID=392032 RepID=A0A817XQQ8_9BILA|nr:unnamed protein product [Rotaria socialis]CAF4885206.1 unnamed protein product [Rotaria socialis]